MDIILNTVTPQDLKSIAIMGVWPTELYLLYRPGWYMTDSLMGAIGMRPTLAA